jgi:xylose isomerase
MARKYSVILGNLGNTKDRFCGSYKQAPSTVEMLKQAALIPNVKGIELVGTWDINAGNASQIKMILNDSGLACTSIIPDLFSDAIYARGSLCNSDAAVRKHALNNVRQICDIALDLQCELINIWPGQDGYDYLLSSDYELQRAWLCEGITELARTYPSLRFALEYKPKEPRTHSYLARMADTLLLANETKCANVGVTIDTGHAFCAGEVVGESIVLAKRADRKLFHMHFNDNHASWDDDMIVGTVHTICFIEMLYWLDRCGYDGWLSMDQYPYRENAAMAITESILWLTKFDAIVQEHRSELNTIIAANDPVATSQFLRKVL